MKKLIILLLVIIPFNTYALTDSSKGSIVMDVDSGRILYQKNSNTSMLIASTTKLMTFLVANKYAGDKLNSKITVGEEVLKAYGTNMYLSISEEITLRDLLYGLMLRSGNDASIEIAYLVAGSIDDFVSLMNLEANNLGMLNTNFKNPHGLDEETKNYSTAYDLAILTRTLALKYPLFTKIAGAKYYNFKTNLKSYALINRAKIIFDYKKITTAKTGYTPLAGKSLITTANNNDLNLVMVSLNNPNHYEEQKNMYEYFFKTYKNYKLLDKNNFHISNVFNSSYEIKNNFTYPLTKEEAKKVETKVIINKKDNILGSIQVILNDDVIHEELIYKKETKKTKKNIFKKIFTKIINFFK